MYTCIHTQSCPLIVSEVHYHWTIPLIGLTCYTVPCWFSGCIFDIKFCFFIYIVLVGVYVLLCLDAFSLVLYMVPCGLHIHLCVIVHLLSCVVYMYVHVYVSLIVLVWCTNVSCVTLMVNSCVALLMVVSITFLLHCCITSCSLQTLCCTQFITEEGKPIAAETLYLLNPVASVRSSLDMLLPTHSSACIFSRSLKDCHTCTCTYMCMYVCRSSGFVMEGFPSNADELQFLASKGQFPDTAIIMQVCMCMYIVYPFAFTSVHFCASCKTREILIHVHVHVYMYCQHV